MGQEYSTIVQIIVKADRGKAIAWRSVSCKMTCYQYKNSINSRSAFSTRSAVRILYPVCNLPSAFFTDRIGITVFVRASLKSGPKYRGSKNCFSKTILAAMIDVWTVCWRAPEEKHNDRAMITLYQLKTNANARLTSVAACLWCSSSWSRRVLEWTRYVLLTFTKWGGVACFRSRSMMQLPSTEYNFRPRYKSSVSICFNIIPHSLLPAWS